MAYSVEYRREAARYVQRLGAKEQARVLAAIEALAEDPDDRTLDVKKLINREGLRLRVGKFRILFERFDERLLILVVAVKPRGEAYKE